MAVKNPLNPIPKLHKFASALARDVSLSEMAELVTAQFQLCLGSDATCTFLRRKDDVFEMIASRGCTEAFRRDWAEIPMGALQFPPNNHDHLFMGTPEDFKALMPFAKSQVDDSGRRYIGFAHLEANGICFGMIGFSYNHDLDHPPDNGFVTTLVELCSDAMDRAKRAEAIKLAVTEKKLANHAKENFLANMSHEIRTPIGLIQGYADLLSASQSLSAKERHWVSVILHNTRELTTMIGEVLDLTKVASKKLLVETNSFSPTELIEELINEITPKAVAKGLGLFAETTNLPLLVHSDRKYLRRILQNLLVNAVKFTTRGAVSLRVTLTNAGVLEFFVEDSGVGISESDQAQLFDPFMQVDNSYAREQGGAGVGLAISREYARALGGDLELVGSEQGIGSKFALRLPCRDLGLPTTLPRANTPWRDEQALAQLHILFVDDSEDNRDLLQHVLSKSGATVELANDGAEGVRKMLGTHFDVVLMDIQMPKMTGLEAIEKLRAMGYRQPVVALTAHALSGERAHALHAGFDDYITKPIERDSLLRCLEKLGRRSQSQ